MRHLQIFKVIGIILILLGIGIRYQIGKRRFNRRNIAGIEQFTSYKKLVTTRTGEGFARFMANLLIFLGILLLLGSIL